MVQFFLPNALTKWNHDCPRSCIRLWKFCAPKSGSAFFSLLLLHQPDQLLLCFTVLACALALQFIFLFSSGCFAKNVRRCEKKFLLLCNSGRCSLLYVFHFFSRLCRRLFLISFLHMASQGRRERCYYFMLIFFFPLHIILRQSAMSFSTCWENGTSKRERKLWRDLALVYFHILLFTSLSNRKKENLEYCTQCCICRVFFRLLCVHSTLQLLFSSHPFHATDT